MNSYTLSIRRLLAPLLVCTSLLGLAAPAARAAQPVSVYIGTWAQDDGKGIYLCHLDPASGKLTLKGRVSDIERPGFLAVHPTGRFIYAITASPKYREQGQGGVASFEVEASSGKLTLLNEQSAMGDGPTHINVDNAGRTVLVANYGDGTVASYPLLADGRLGPAGSVHQHTGSSVHPQRQKSPRAHSLYAAPGDRFVVGADLGIDKIMIYRLDAARGRLEPNEPPFGSLAPGSGPRHMAFHPDGRRLFALNEINSTLTLFSWNGNSGELDQIITVPTLPSDFGGNSTAAEVVVHPSGQFVYASNRGHDSIAIFGYDGKADELEPIGYEPTQGPHPRHFNVDPTGRWLIVANRDTEELVVFGIDLQTGRLTPTGQKVSVPRPVCVKFLPASSAASAR